MVKRISINKPLLRWQSDCRQYTVLISEYCLCKMTEMAQEHYPNEVGTSLVGSYSDDGFEASVLELRFIGELQVCEISLQNCERSSLVDGIMWVSGIAIQTVNLFRAVRITVISWRLQRVPKQTVLNVFLLLSEVQILTSIK